MKEFSSIRYNEDHRKETDPDKVRKILSKPIPLKKPEKVLHNTFIFMDHIFHKSSVRCGPYQARMASSQGPREYMEDTFYTSEITIEGREPVYLFAIFDGHGGDQCAKFVKTNLKKYIINNLNTSDELSCYNSLKELCVLLDEAWREYVFRKTAQSIDYSGTTAVICLVIHSDLWVINIGDSRAVLGKGGQAIQLTEDAKPTIAPYRDEIIRRGGFIEWNRVDGNLDLARSIGDVEHPSVSARPTIRKFELNELDSDSMNILILATDGLWDAIGSQEAVSYFHGDRPLRDQAADLIALAYSRGSTDNITVMVVPFL